MDTYVLISHDYDEDGADTVLAVFLNATTAIDQMRGYAGSMLMTDIDEPELWLDNIKILQDSRPGPLLPGPVAVWSYQDVELRLVMVVAS